MAEVFSFEIFKNSGFLNKSTILNTTYVCISRTNRGIFCSVLADVHLALALYMDCVKSLRRS